MTSHLQNLRRRLQAIHECMTWPVSSYNWQHAVHHTLVAKTLVNALEEERKYLEDPISAVHSAWDLVRATDYHDVEMQAAFARIVARLHTEPQPRLKSE